MKRPKNYIWIAFHAVIPELTRAREQKEKKWFVFVGSFLSFIIIYSVHFKGFASLNSWKVPMLESESKDIKRWKQSFQFLEMYFDI